MRLWHRDGKMERGQGPPPRPPRCAVLRSPFHVLPPLQSFPSQHLPPPPLFPPPPSLHRRAGGGSPTLPTGLRDSLVAGPPTFKGAPLTHTSSTRGGGQGVPVTRSRTARAAGNYRSYCCYYYWIIFPRRGGAAAGARPVPRAARRGAGGAGRRGGAGAPVSWRRGGGGPGGAGAARAPIGRPAVSCSYFLLSLLALGHPETNHFDDS